MRYPGLLMCVLLFGIVPCSAQVFRGYNEDGFRQTTERKSRRRQEVRRYYPDGTLHFVATYKRGELDGDAREYYDDGILKAEVRFRDGQREGIARYYYPDGMLKARVLYDDDVEKGKSKFYNEEGVLSREEGVSQRVSSILDTLGTVHVTPSSRPDNSASENESDEQPDSSE